MSMNNLLRFDLSSHSTLLIRFSLTGHAECVGLVRDLGLPLLVLGGGGYTVRNVARCWTLETAVLLNTDLPSQLPRHEYWEYFAPDFSLTPQLTKRLDLRLT